MWIGKAGLAEGFRNVGNGRIFNAAVIAVKERKGAAS